MRPDRRTSAQPDGCRVVRPTSTGKRGADTPAPSEADPDDWAGRCRPPPLVVPLLHAASGQVAVSIHRIGCPAPKVLAAALGMVEPEGAARSRTSRGHALASVQRHLPVPYAPPRPFQTLSTHRSLPPAEPAPAGSRPGAACALEHASELRAPVGVEDLRTPPPAVGEASMTMRNECETCPRMTARNHAFRLDPPSSS